MVVSQTPREVVEELARRLAQEANKAYASHFRQILKVLPAGLGAEGFHDWLASLDEKGMKALAAQLEQVEGKPRPHFVSALKRARAVVLGEKPLREMPSSFPEALRWAIERASLSVRTLAGASDVKEKTLWGWLAGRQLPSSRAAVEKLEEALGLPQGALAQRLSRWGRQKFGVHDKRHRRFTQAFLRLAARARYGVPWSDLREAERKALLREDEERWGRSSNRQLRTSQAVKTPYGLPYEAWPERAQVEWRGYEAFAAAPQRSRQRAERVLRGEEVAARPVRETTLTRERQMLERFYGYCRNELGLEPGLELLTRVDLVESYLAWRWRRYDEDVHPLTKTETGFIAFLKKLHGPQGYLRAAGYETRLEEIKALEKRLARAGVDETPGYHAVEPLLETDDPLYWLVEGLKLLLLELKGLVGDLRRPAFPASKKLQQEALALYRDAVLWWALTAHPLRAKHWYGARLDLKASRQGEDFPPGEGHLGREGGVYYLAYRKREFKNAASKIFKAYRDDDLIRFPLQDPEHPHLSLEVDGKVSLNELVHVYLVEVHPRLLGGGSAGAAPLFPRLESETRLRAAVSNRSAAVAALPGVPAGVLPFGPHAFRHVVATAIVKTTGSFEAAANVLLDSIEMVARHYARFAPADRYRFGWRAYGEALRRKE